MAAKHLPERNQRANGGKASTKDSTGGQASAGGRSEDAHCGKASVEGKGHHTLSSKASAREKTNDNGGKASASENKDGQASILRERMVAKYLLRKPNDSDKVKHCRIARIQPIFLSVHFFGPYPSD